METQTQPKVLSTAEKVYNTIKRGAKKYYEKNREKVRKQQKIWIINLQENEPERYEELLRRNNEWKKQNKDKANQRNRESYKRRMEKKKAEKLLAKQEQNQPLIKVEPNTEIDTDSETNSD